MTDQGMTYAGRFNALMAELGELREKAGGWSTDIPPVDRAAWMARKVALFAEIEAHEAQRTAVTA